MNTTELLLRVFHPGRFLRDPRRYTPSLKTPDSGGLSLHFHDSSGALSFTASAYPQGDLWKAEASFEAQSKSVIASLRTFAKRHGVPIPSRFERSWDPNSAAAGDI